MSDIQLESEVIRLIIAIAITFPILLTYIFYIVSRIVQEMHDSMLVHKVKTFLNPYTSFAIFKGTISITCSLMTWAMFLYTIYAGQPGGVFATMGFLVITAAMYPLLSTFDD